MPTPFTQVDNTYLNSVTFEGYADNIEKIYQEFLTVYKEESAMLYMSENVGEYAETVKRYDEQDMNQYANDKPQGNDAQRLAFGVGYTKSVFAFRVGAQLNVSYEMRVAKRFELSKAIQRFVSSAPSRMELDRQHRLTFSNALSYINISGRVVDVTVGSGGSLINSVNPLAFTTITFSNLVPGGPAGSVTALESAEQLFVTDILDNFGLPVVMDPSHVICCKQDPNTVRVFAQILRSTTLVTQANPGVVNTFLQKYELMVLSRVATTATGATDSSKAKWWFLAALKGINRLQSHETIWEAPHMNPTPAGSNNGVDPYNDDYTFGARARYGHAITSGRGIVASFAS
jgi:hypothetical protein